MIIMIPFYAELLIAVFDMQVSVGTLLAFTMVAISVLILRYVPPDEVPLPSSLRDSIDSVSLQYGKSTRDVNGEDSKVNVATSKDSAKPLLGKEDASAEYPLIAKQLFQGNCTLPALSSYLSMVFVICNAYFQ
jgi:cationic amino acid transporter 1